MIGGAAGSVHVLLIGVAVLAAIFSRRKSTLAVMTTALPSTRVLSTAYRLGAGMAGRHNPGWTLVRQGCTEEAERVAIAAAERIQLRMFERDAAKAGVFGRLLFDAATAALVDGNASRADDLMQQVDRVARAGDPERALHSAASIPGTRGEVPAFWEAGHRLRLAAAALELRRDGQALDFLFEARDLAPDWVRYQPLGKTTMRHLVDRAARRRGPSFADLARHYGVVAGS